MNQIELVVSATEAEGLATEQGQAIQDFEFNVPASTHRQLMQSTVTTRSNTIKAMVEDIRILPGFNPRLPGPEMDAHIRHIADSILKEGFFEHKPLGGFAGKDGKKAVIYVFDGECRFRGTQLANEEGAGVEEVPIVLAPEGTDLATLLVSMVRSNNNSKPFTPMELSIICQRMKKEGVSEGKEGMSNEAIGERLGFTAEYVRGLLTLSEAPEAIKDMVTQGTVAAALAIDTVRKHGEEASEVLKTAVETAKASGREKVRKSDFAQKPQTATIKRAAPQMLAVLTEVKNDQAYMALPESLREKIEDLFKQIQCAPAKAKDENKQGAAAESVG